ncbi:hypothetical protein HZB03_04735, partial [Candidatus Woesearchaeota archaeon]|nr:hypothetical protein [Candidatus Woesearchaeota archaeon]
MERNTNTPTRGTPPAAIDPLALDLKSDFRFAPIGRRRGQSSSVFGRLHARLEVGCIQIVWMFRKSLIFDNKGGTPLWGRHIGERRSSVNTYTSRAWRGGAGLLPSSQPSV